jgi:hypothetical protein
MKKNLLVSVILFQFFSVIPYSIVFVHLGSELPHYVITALGQSRLFNKNCDLYLIAHKQALQKSTFDFDGVGVKLVAADDMQLSQEHRDFLSKTTLDRNSRGGFWLYASERFLYLADLMEAHDLHDVFHLESDNMLYVDISTILPIFQQHYKGIGAVFDNDERCIPGFIYFANKRASKKLASCFAQHAHENKNDMYVLGLFKREYGKTWLDTLPIIMKSYTKSHELGSAMGHKAQRPAQYWNNLVEFTSLFDGAAIGQYLGGIDPRNGPCRPGFINESCLFNPSKVHFLWQMDSEGRRVPYMAFNGESYRINNLHIHSKLLDQFVSKKFVGLL